MEINKSDKPASGFWRRLLFHVRRGRGHLWRYAWNRVRWHLYPRFRWSGAYPDHVDLELSAACNMKCPMCYTTTEPFKTSVPHVTMDFDLYRRIVDELAAKGVYSIRLSWRGEPTMHPRFMDFVRYAKGKGIPEVDSLTNGLRLTVEMFEELVDLGMDWLTISFDGTGETYDRIRAPARYDEMLEKIRAFAAIKKRKRQSKPVIRLQGVWPAIAENPEKYFETFEPLVDEVSVNTLLDYLHKDEEIQYLPNFTCPVPFQRLVIGSDGRAFMCINDELGRVPVGDAKTQSIKEIWGGPALEGVRRVHKRGAGVATYAPCRDCYQPRAVVRVPRRVGARVIWLEELAGRRQEVGR